MGKRKAEKNAAFKKVKLKVGKKLKKTASTDTTFKAKKVVISSQLSEKKSDDSKPLSYRGLALDDLCKQLGHFNKNIRKDAVVGLKQLLSSRADLVHSQLRTLIPSIARLIADPTCDSSTHSQLRSLFELLCSAPSHAMSAHFQLFLAHVLRALSQLQMHVRTFALSVLKIMMLSYKDLCRNNNELFQSFVHFLGTNRKPLWSTKGFLECIAAFIRVFDVDAGRKEDRMLAVTLDCKDGTVSGFVDLTPSGCPFLVPVLCPSVSGQASPFELPEAALQLSGVLAPILYTALSEDQAGAFLGHSLAIIECMGRAIERQTNSFLVPDFRQRLSIIWDNVKKVVEKKKSENIRRQAAWILALG